MLASEAQLPWAQPTDGTTTLRPMHGRTPAQLSGPQLNQRPTSESLLAAACAHTGPCTDQYDGLTHHMRRMGLISSSIWRHRARLPLTTG